MRLRYPITWIDRESSCRCRLGTIKFWCCLVLQRNKREGSCVTLFASMGAPVKLKNCESCDTSNGPDRWTRLCQELRWNALSRYPPYSTPEKSRRFCGPWKNYSGRIFRRVSERKRKGRNRCVPLRNYSTETSAKTDESLVKILK